jgi:hypothetical protein
MSKTAKSAKTHELSKHMNIYIEKQLGKIVVQNDSKNSKLQQMSV